MDDVKRNSDNSADELLIRLIAEKDQSALSMFYDNRSKLIYSLVFNIVKSVPDAEEVTEDVFFKVWQKADTYDKSKGSVLAWLVTIARRMALDRTRSKHYKHQQSDVTMEEAFVHSEAGTAYVTNPGDKTDVNRALENLDNSHRELIDLSYYQGMSQTQIADQLDMPLGTVKSRMRSALKQLRQVFDIKEA